MGGTKSRPEARRNQKEKYMPRRAAAVRREVQPDAQYNNRLVTQLKREDLYKMAESNRAFSHYRF